MKTASAEGVKPRLELGTLNQRGFQKISESFEDGETSRTLERFYSLVDATRSTGNGWYMSAKIFPRDEVELVAMKLEADDKLRNGGGSIRKNSDKSEMDMLTLKKSQNRARKTVRHKLMMMQADRMLTLTYRENMTDLEIGWKHFKKFSALMKWRFKERWTYVCVPEYQKRGAIHFHLAISGFYPVDTVRKLWRQVVGEGNIDITSPAKIKRNSWNPRRIAGYLSKYISKNDSVIFNRRRYSSARIEPPLSITGWAALGKPIQSIMSRLMKALTRRPLRDYWEAEGYFPVCMMTT